MTGSSAFVSNGSFDYLKNGKNLSSHSSFVRRGPQLLGLALRSMFFNLLMVHDFILFKKSDIGPYDLYFFGDYSHL